jgi:hypothetical protein
MQLKVPIIPGVIQYFLNIILLLTDPEQFESPEVELLILFVTHGLGISVIVRIIFFLVYLLLFFIFNKLYYWRQFTDLLILKKKIEALESLKKYRWIRIIIIIITKIIIVDILMENIILFFNQNIKMPGLSKTHVVFKIGFEKVIIIKHNFGLDLNDLVFFFFLLVNISIVWFVLTILVLLLVNFFKKLKKKFKNKK